MRHSKSAILIVAFIASSMYGQDAAAPAAIYTPTQVPGAAVQPGPARFDFHPEKDGVYKPGGDVKAPKVRHTVPAELSTEAKTRGAFTQFTAVSKVSFVVDVQGVPQDICVMRPAGFGLDEEAAKAVRQYRFEPAKKNGAPVAARAAIEVGFHN
jgi:periplasmic protein TonB